MRKTLVLIAWFSVLVPSAVFADWKSHPIGLSVWVPDDWRMETDGDTMMVGSPDDAVVFAYMAMKGKKLEDAAGVIEQQLKEMIQEPKFEKPEEIKINDVSGVMASGTGKVDGTKISWGIAVFFHGDGCLILLGLAQEGKADKHTDTVGKMLKSVKKTSSP